MPENPQLEALRQMIVQAREVIVTSDLPADRTRRAGELLTAAVALADDLLAQPASAAAALGKKGGAKTAERGPEYFAKIAAMRKTKAGGRPGKKELEN